MTMLDEAGVHSEASGLLVTIAWMTGAVIAAYILTAGMIWLARLLMRRSGMVGEIARRLRNPVRVTLIVLAAWFALNMTGHQGAEWYDLVEKLVIPAVIVTSAWLLGNLAVVAERRVYAKIRVDVDDWRQRRKLRTQVMMVRRIIIGVLSVLAFAGIMMTFPAARTVGASLLASAGLVSVVAALAAQSSLGNVFAGIQVAFTNRIHIGDVVVVEGEWGRIEDITLAYVVVNIWDDRRLILPCKYFTDQPYENWTRNSSNLLGVVELDLDFRTPLGPMRDELRRICEAHDLWDTRHQGLEVIDATGGMVRVRATVSARDGSDLWYLQCQVREMLITWVQREALGSLPRTRFEPTEGDPVSAAGLVPSSAREVVAPTSGVSEPSMVD